MSRGPATIAAARAANAVFFLATSAYCLIAYTPFAYHQFLKPEVIPWIPDFVACHAALFWLALFITTWTLLPHVRSHGSPHPERPRRSQALRRLQLSRLAAGGYIGAGMISGAVLTVRPVLPTIGSTPWSLVVGLGALVPIVWLALFDHVAAGSPEPCVASSEAHLLRASVATAAAVWAIYAAGAPLRLQHVVGIDLPVGSLFMAFGLSALAHLFVFMAVFLVLLILRRTAALTSASGVVEYWLLVAALALAIAVIVQRLVFASLTFVGAGAWGAAFSIGVALALGWSGVAQWHALARSSSPARSGASDWSALGLFLTPIVGQGSRRMSALVLAGLLPLVCGLSDATARIDWNFLVQKISVLAIWFVTFASAYTVTASASRASRRGKALVAIVPLITVVLVQGVAEAAPYLPRWTHDDRLVPAVVLDRYAAIDMSFRLIRDARTTRAAETTDFYAALEANTLVRPASVDPDDIDFAPLDSGVRRRPHVFLFVIDSLRRDYLSPYNPSVTFTPNIGRFAAGSFVFERAFTRYSGTGMAVPSIWAGAMLIHMLDQQRFDGRDALLKLLDAGEYRRIMSFDHIIRDIVPGGDDVVELDRGVRPMDCDLCRTLQELEQAMTRSATDPNPVFAYALPQNVHIAVASRRAVAAGESYPGFFAPVAASVADVDRCFGEFVEYLKRSNIYDDSVIILTSDHGDSLGEEGRWGHSYFMVPEVMRIPLIIHLPPAMAKDVTAALARLAFSTDITPTLYALLGHQPADRGRLFGTSLFVPRGTTPASRRGQSFLLASSYGAVYGMLRHNGRTLYTADAIDGRDDAYDLGADGPGRRIAITPSLTALNRRLIREELAELASLNHFTPEP